MKYSLLLILFLSVNCFSEELYVEKAKYIKLNDSIKQLKQRMKHMDEERENRYKAMNDRKQQRKEALANQLRRNRDNKEFKSNLKKYELYNNSEDLNRRFKKKEKK